MKIGLERIDTQKGITVEALLDSGATGLVMNSEFAKKQSLKLKKLERPMNVRNMDGLLNKEGPIEHTVEVNIYYQGHRERTEIDDIGGQKWTVILGIPWLVRHNPEIDWRTGEVKMTRCPEECGKQWRLVQGKLGWEKQKEEEARKEAGKKREEKEKRKRKKEKTMEVKKIAEEWEIWDEEEKAARSEVKAKKLVPERFYEWIKVFGKKQLERMPTRKVWDHAIDVKEGFVLKKRKVYPLLREEKEEVRKFIEEQLRKEYIQLSKSPQTVPVFFVGKKDGKKRMVQNYQYLNEWTIKNNYLLPLILDVLENIGTKKVFTKMDLRWKRLEENDLYVKSEKCKWKVRKVGFLRVIIGPEGIKMEEEKVKGVLEWLTPKCVKDMQKFLGLVNYYR